MFIHRQLNTIKLLDTIELLLSKSIFKWYVKESAAKIILKYFVGKTELLEKKHINTLSKFEKDREEFGDMVDKNLILEVFKIPSFKEIVARDLFDQLALIVDKYTFEGKTVTLYKAIEVPYDYVEYIKRSKKIKVGSFWVLNKENAEPPKGHSKKFGKRYIFSYTTDVENISWDDTFMLSVLNIKDKEVMLPRYVKMASFILEDCYTGEKIEYFSEYTRGKKRFMT